MPSDISLQFAPNGDVIKVSRVHSNRVSKPFIVVNKGELLRCSAKIRGCLAALNEYIRRNSRLEEARDPGWRDYAQTVRSLQEAGRALRNTLFDDSSERVRSLLHDILTLAPEAQLILNYSDEQATLPFGFIFEGEPSAPEGRPARAHFENFWLRRVKITVSLMNDDAEAPEDRLLDPSSFRALYALNKAELENAKELLADAERSQLDQLISLPVKAHYDWSTARNAWCTETNLINVLFVFAHSDGDWLELNDGSQKSSLDSQTFCKQFTRKEDGPATILIMNCCKSAIGAEGRSILSAVARPGFAGLIGTEAEILNTYAVRCGTHLMWSLCARDCNLGEAFDNLQSSEDLALFPLNLFYTCYADRSFRLRAPVCQAGPVPC